MKRFYYGILGWGVFLTIASIGGLLLARPSLLNGLVNPWVVSAVMLAVGLFMVLDFFSFPFFEKRAVSFDFADPPCQFCILSVFGDCCGRDGV